MRCINRFWIISVLICFALFFLTLTISRTITIQNLYTENFKLQQERIRLGLLLSSASPAYIDSMACSQARELADVKKRVKKLEDNMINIKNPKVSRIIK